MYFAARKGPGEGEREGKGADGAGEKRTALNTRVKQGSVVCPCFALHSVACCLCVCVSDPPEIIVYNDLSQHTSWATSRPTITHHNLAHSSPLHSTPHKPCLPVSGLSSLPSDCLPLLKNQPLCCMGGVIEYECINKQRVTGVTEMNEMRVPLPDACVRVASHA